MERKNKNRGYQQLRVWQESVELYKVECRIFGAFPYVLAKNRFPEHLLGGLSASNIAEGFCRRSIKEYLQHLYVALGSLGETVSGAIACKSTFQISEADFEPIDQIAFRLENGMLRLVESLKQKRDSGSWIDSMVIRITNAVYLSPESRG